jgi:ABC-type antimicrobial peptide transport system permease subunit
VYYPFNQSPDRSFSLVVRTAQAEQPVLQAVRAVINRIDPGIGTRGGATMSDRIHDSPSAYLHRSSAWLVGGFAGLALLLAVVGLYGVVAYSVSQRTGELGVRIALGASRRSVYELILGEAGVLAAIGIVAGLVCAVGAARLGRPLLFGTTPWDLPTLGGVAVLLAASALAASYVPAHRAASIDPTEALRAE